MNLSIQQIQLILDGLNSQLFDLLDEMRNTIHGDEDKFKTEIVDVLDLMIKFIKLRKEKMSYADA